MVVLLWMKIAKLCGNLSLTEEKRCGLFIPDGVIDDTLSNGNFVALVDYYSLIKCESILFSLLCANFGVFQEKFTLQLLSLTSSLYVSKKKKNIFLVEFSNALDREKVLMGYPCYLTKSFS